jgi:ATP adenylyltransferase
MCGLQTLPSVVDMTWTQQHERMAFMANLIDRAAENPDTAINFDGDMLEVQRLFGSQEALILTLQQRWLMALTAKLDQADYDGVSAEQARAALAAQQSGLRRLLDEAARRSVRVRALQREEQRIVEIYDCVPGNHVAPQQTVA